MKRKFLASLLALCMALTAVPGAWAAEGEGVECTEENCTHVAAIGATHYETLDAAGKAVQNNETITIINDVDSNTDYFTIANVQGVTIDLNGKVVKASGDWGVVYCQNDATVTIDGTTPGSAVYAYEVGMQPTKPDPSGYATVVCAGEGSEIIIDGGHYENIVETENAEHFDCIYASGANASIEILDGTFKNATPKWTLNLKDNSGANIVVKGGEFYQFDPQNADTEPSEKPKNYVAEGYVSVENGDYYEVVHKSEVAVAQIGSDYYETLPLAVTAAKNGETITLLRSVEGEGFVATADNDFVLDLAGETYTINKTVGSAGTESNGIQLLKGATVEIKDGEIKFDNAKIGIKNYCDLTLENVQLVNTATANPVINNCGQLVINGKETVIEAPAYKWAITTGNYQKGDVITTEINGGEISSVACETPLWETGAAVDESVTTTINGGTIGEIGVYDWRADYGPDYADAPLLTNWKMIVNGGEIGELSFDENSLGKVTINGGHFVEDPSDYVAADLAALKSHKTGYTYEVRKPATYTVTFTTDHGTAPEQVVETETFADTVVTLPNAPAVEGYTFLGWTLEGETYPNGAEYTVTKDVTFTAKWAENVDTPVVDEEVVILPSTPVVSEPVISGKPEDEAAAMKDMAEALQQPGAVEVEGLTDAAKDEIRDAAAATDKNEAFQKIVEDALAADPDADITTTIVLEPYMDIQVKDAQVDGDKIAVELELTPMVKAKATIDPQHMTEANTVVLYTQEMNVTETVTITLPLPQVFAGNTENLYVKHETGKKTYYYDTTVANGKVAFENPHGFSTFTLVTDDRYAEVQLGDLLCEFFPSDVGMSLDMEDAYDAPRGEYFVGWKFDGISGVHDTLTDELLTKLAEKYSEDGEAVQAKPVFDEKSSGGSVDRGYAIRVEKTENGKVTAPSSATVGSTVTIKVKPDAGYQLDELVVTDRDGDELKLTDKGNGKFTFKMPKSKVTVEATFVEIEREPEVQELPFVDVADTAYYADAVRWAVAEGITGGTSAATFSPNAACTRAQAVTFLWRAAGSPVVNYAMGFTDVPADAYYAEAVRWAVSQGITTGATETTFAPDAPCTRAQIVTFIYRNVKAQGGGFTGSWMFPCPFTDVSADAYYFESVQWCVMKGITEGATETTFAPDATCTRAQIVTFLYRGAEK